MKDIDVICKSKKQSLFDISRVDKILNINRNQFCKIEFDKLTKMIKIKIIKKEYQNSIIVMKYENDENKKSKLVGEKFHKLNQNKYIIIRNNKQIKLKNNKCDEKRKGKFIIKIKLIEDLINIDSMFYGCSSLTNLIFKSNLNTNKVEDMSYIFYDCSSLKSL